MAISLEADPSLAQGYIKVNGTTAATLDATGITTGGVPAGAVMAFAMNSAPSGWLAADGAAISRSEYARLFAAVGTTHGVGNGSTTFNLPDLRGIFVRGSGSQTVSGATFTGTFGQKQTDGLRDHTHRINGALLSAGGASPGVQVFRYHIPDTTGARDLAMTAGTDAGETRPANIAMLYCIKF